MAEKLKNKKIIVAVTGSIAAYKSPLLVRELIKEGANVQVVMTPSAQEFVTRLTLSNLSKNPVVSEMFDIDKQNEGAWHIQLAHWCDLMIIAPCSATTLSRVATGNCDSALSTIAIAMPRSTPLIISPAMDTTMWEHPATQRNLNIVKNDGAVIIPPESGDLASGLSGAGRLPEIDILMKYINDTISPLKKSSNEDQKKKLNNNINELVEKPVPSLQDTVDKDKWNAEFELEQMKQVSKSENSELSLAGKKILITAGPTQEKIDDVRFISNYSSGKMGFALAEAAFAQGAEVSLITGPVALDTPSGIKRIDVKTAEEMYLAAIDIFPQTDIAIMSAAVADYAPQKASEGKLKKDSIGEKMTLDLIQTKDILSSLGIIKNKNQKLIGFALESANELENGRKKLKTKNCDMIVVNSANKPKSGFGGDYNTITIVTEKGEEAAYPPMSKDKCADIILEKIISL